MAKITCPKCGTTFDVSDIDPKAMEEATKKQVEERLKLEIEKFKLENDKKQKESLSSLNEQIKTLESTIALNKKDADLAVQNVENQKQKEIDALNAKLNNADLIRQNAIKDEKAKSTEVLNALKNEIDMLKKQMESKINEAKLQAENDYNSKINQKDIDIAKLKGEKELSINKIKQEYENQIAEINKKNETESKLKDEEIQQLRDFKSRLNSKELGEELEQYCQNKFNEIRVNSYPNCYFEKDSDVSKNGEKGDYIFRDYFINDDGSKVEYVSIMFDMKNENQNTKSKQKNSDKFDKLDRDRKTKKCEYAVLVSCLETDNPMYSKGITDVSYGGHEKMFVVRPDYFLEIISLIRTFARDKISTKKELILREQSNIEVTKFEKNLEEWKKGWSYNMGQAKKRFETAIGQIDDTINKLTNIRENLTKSMDQIDNADRKVIDLKGSKIAKDSPELRKEFKEYEKNNPSSENASVPTSENSDK